MMCLLLGVESCHRARNHVIKANLLPDDTVVKCCCCRFCRSGIWIKYGCIICGEGALLKRCLKSRGRIIYLA